MTANATFKVGDRIAIDRQEDVLVVELRCSMCTAQGKSEAVLTPATRVWVPALFKRWVPQWEQEKFMSLEEAILKEPALAALVREHNGRKEAERLCADHGKTLRTARIWTESLFFIMKKQAAAADRKALEAFGSVASILKGKAAAATRAQGGESEDDDAAAQARAEQEAIQRRTLAASRKRTREGGDHRPKDSSSRKGRGRRKDQRAAEAEA